MLFKVTKYVCCCYFKRSRKHICFVSRWKEMFVTISWFSVNHENWDSAITVHMYKICLINKRTASNVAFGCKVMLITVRKTVGCLSEQPRGTCRMTWSLFFAVRTVRLFIKQPLYITHIRTHRGHLYLRKIRPQIWLSLQTFSIS